MLLSNGASLFEDLGVNLIEFHFIQALSSENFCLKIFVVKGLKVKIPRLFEGSYLW